MNGPVRDARVRELSKMPKAKLAALYGSRHTFVYLAAPLVRWSKDELINAILEDEFPQGRPQPPTLLDEIGGDECGGDECGDLLPGDEHLPLAANVDPVTEAHRETRLAAAAVKKPVDLMANLRASLDAVRGDVSR